MSVESLVSTIIPVFNRPAQLVDATHSVLGQEYSPIEILIVNDGSTDGETHEAAESLCRTYPAVVRVLHISNSGPGTARERGRLLAAGEYIQYLDSDDVLLPGKFKAQVAALQASKAANVAYGVTLTRNRAGELSKTAHKGTGSAAGHMFPRFLVERWWETATPLYRASICDAAGPWTDLRLEEDWEYDCRIAAKGGALVYCPFPVSEHRDHCGHRLSVVDGEAPRRLAMRARAHELVWQHALRAQLPERHPFEVGRFAQALFLLARQCGAAGLESHSARLLRLAAEAALVGGPAARQLRVYQWVSRVIGLRGAGRLAHYVDCIRAVTRSHASD